MKAFHLVGPAPFYTNSFLLISDAGNAVIIDPAAEVQEYDKILKEHGGRLSLILCTHGHYDHVGSAGVLSREWGAKLYCEPADCQGTQLLPLKGSDSGYEEGEVIPLDELRFTVWHTPGHTEGSVVLLSKTISSWATPSFRAASAAPTSRAATAGRWTRACASLRPCPSRLRRRCCPATAIFLPSGRRPPPTSISKMR